MKSLPSIYRYHTRHARTVRSNFTTSQKERHQHGELIWHEPICFLFEVSGRVI
ncbi:MAG: hypothetical protein ACFC03_00630 [Candidatus Malihini olakiniferum]